MKMETSSQASDYQFDLHKNDPELLPGHDVFLDGWNSGSDELSILIPDTPIATNDVGFLGNDVVPDLLSISSSGSSDGSGRSTPLMMFDRNDPVPTVATMSTGAERAASILHISQKIHKDVGHSSVVMKQQTNDRAPSSGTGSIAQPSSAAAVAHGGSVKKSSVNTSATVATASTQGTRQSTQQAQPPPRAGSFFDILTDEERRMMEAEGVTIPPQGPLSKSDEREFKRLRRQIKNKYSAKDSRRKRKEYMEQLEQANSQLHTRLSKFKSENGMLKKQLQQINRLFRHGRSKGASKAAGIRTSASLLMMCLVFSRRAGNMHIDESEVSSDSTASRSAQTEILVTGDKGRSRVSAVDLEALTELQDLKPLGQADQNEPPTNEEGKRLVRDAITKAGLGRFLPDDELDLDSAMVFEPSFGPASKELDLPPVATPLRPNEACPL